jgi:hypothetical protein
MSRHDKRINKVKKNFYRFLDRLLGVVNQYFYGLVYKEDIKEAFYLYDLIMFLVNKNINFDIYLEIFIPTGSGEIDKTVFDLECFDCKLSVFTPISYIMPSEKSFNNLEMSFFVSICSEVDKSLIGEVSKKYGLKFQKDDRYITYGGYCPQSWAKVYYTCKEKKIVFENFEPIKIFFALGK